MIQWLKRLFWKRCHYCKQKKEYFFYIWETSRYDPTKDYTNEESEICVDCIANYGDVPATTYVYEPEPASSFKNRAEYIKKKFNYRFKDRPVVDDSLKDFPDLNKIIWKKKKPI